MTKRKRKRKRRAKWRRKIRVKQSLMSRKRSSASL